MRAVGKVAELRFPNHQVVRCGAGIAVFVGHDGFFVQDGVDDGEVGLVVRHVLQRCVNAGVGCAAVGVVQHGVAMRERAASGVFARNAHAGAVGYHAGIGKGFRHAPINRLFAFRHFFALLQHAFGGIVQAKSFGDLGEFFRQALDVGGRQAAFHLFAPILPLVFAPIDTVFAFVVGQAGFFDMFAFVQRSAVGIHIAFGFFLGQYAFFHQFFGIQCACAGMFVDGAVHHRLGQGWVVAFVVAQFAEAHNINHHVFLEGVAVVQSSLHGEAHGFRVVTVHVNHWCGHHFGNVGAIHGGTGVAGVGRGEADLVVDDQMDCAAGGIATCVGQIEGGLVHAQADKCGVAVNQHGQNLFAPVRTAAALFGACGTLHDGIDDFQMRRVEGQCDVHGAERRGDVGIETVVVFHVAAGQFGFLAAFKFGK